LIVPVDSSAARIPLPGATRASAVVRIVSLIVSEPPAGQTRTARYVSRIRRA
jgi:hypothetical protein